MTPFRTTRYRYSLTADVYFALDVRTRRARVLFTAPYVPNVPRPHNGIVYARRPYRLLTRAYGNYFTGVPVTFPDRRPQRPRRRLQFAAVSAVSFLVRQHHTDDPSSRSSFAHYRGGEGHHASSGYRSFRTQLSFT